MSIKHQLTLGLLIAGVAFAPRAHAQLAVLDAPLNATASAIASDTGAIATSASTIATQTTATAKTTAQTLTTLTTPPSFVTGIFTDQDGTTQLNPMPQESQVLKNINFNAPALTTTGTTVFDNNNNAAITGTDPETAALKATATTSANIQGMALDNLTALQSRLGELNEMIQSLSTATSITQVTAITGRIAVEQLAVQAQQAQAANLNALAVAQNDIDITNRELAMRQEHQKTAQQFLGGGLPTTPPAGL